MTTKEELEKEREIEKLRKEYIKAKMRYFNADREYEYVKEKMQTYERAFNSAQKKYEATLKDKSKKMKA